jgi:hypothetical protein
VKTNRPTLNEIFSEEYWKNRTSTIGEDSGPIIPWNKGLLFLIPFGGGGVPLILGIANSIAKPANKLWSKLGIKCKKSFEKIFDVYYSEFVFSLVLSLRKLDKTIISAEDTDYGSLIIIDMPRDLKTFGGIVSFEIFEGSNFETKIIATSEVKGQLKDWGKGKDLINEILEATSEFISSAK